MRYVFLVVALLMVAGCALADDIVTMPTANQLKQGEVDVAAYYLKLDMPSVQPQNVNYQTLYVGLTDRIELDAHRADVDKDRDATILVASYKVLGETQELPDVVIGCRNLLGTATSNNNPGDPNIKSKSEKQSYFVCAAKTLFMNPMKPGPPLVRVHAGLGTEDWTLLGEVRHRGLFGGLQFLFRPDIGAVIENDGQDTITGLTIMPKGTGLTIKGGGFGDHWWAGLAFRKTF
jgi:hypothetical protein